VGDGWLSCEMGEVGSWVKLGDGWLSWEMDGQVGRWVTKLGDGWLRLGDGRLSWEMGSYKLVLRACLLRQLSQGSNPDISQKHKMGD
jgi:hypothetical protein